MQADSEKIFLGGLIHFPKFLEEDFLEILKPDYFLNEKNKTVFQAAMNLSKKSEPTDFPFLLDEIKRIGASQKVTPDYLIELATDGQTPTILPYHAKRIVQNYKKRLFEQAMEQGKESSDFESFEELYGKTEKALNQILSLEEGEEISFKDLIGLELERIDNCSDKGGITGLPTGFSKLDEMTSGFHPGEMIVVAGRPSMGKTAFAMNIALHSAKAGKNVGIFSLEMSASQLIQRILSSEAKIGVSDIRRGDIPENEWDKLFSRADSISKLPIRISKITNLNPVEMRIQAKRWKKSQGLDLIILDYLQLMHADGKESREREISEISRTVKSTAIELGIPIIALSQLNRNLENRAADDRRPRLADLRESGSIEQDADLVLFLYREEVYKPTLENSGLAEVIIGKQRNGPIGDFTLKFNKIFTEFKNL